MRVLVRVVLVQGEERGLVAFGTADDHLHAVLITDRASAGAFAMCVELALGQRLRLGTSFERARIRPLQDQRHAYNAFHYVHRQDSHHEIGRDMAREGTSLPDILGLRVVNSSIAARVRAHLPRVRREELVGQFPAGAFDAHRSIDLAVLADAAAAALAIDDLHGRGPDATRARRAAVHVVGPEVRTKRLTESLGITARAVQALRALPPEAAVVRAIRQQALLRTPANELPDVA